MCAGDGFDFSDAVQTNFQLLTIVLFCNQIFLVIAGPQVTRFQDFDVSSTIRLDPANSQVRSAQNVEFILAVQSAVDRAVINHCRG